MWVYANSSTFLACVLITHVYIVQVNTTPYADFKPGIASSYVMEQVFGRLHMTTQAELDAAAAERRASLRNIPEHETTSVLNYFRYHQLLAAFVDCVVGCNYTSIYVQRM